MDFIVLRLHCRQCCLWHCVHHYSLTAVVCVFIICSSQPWTGEWHHKPWSWTVSCKPHKHAYAHTLVCTYQSNLPLWLQTGPVQCVCELVVEYLYEAAFQGFTIFLFLGLPVESTIWGLIPIQPLTLLILPQLERLWRFIEAYEYKWTGFRIHNDYCSKC